MDLKVKTIYTREALIDFKKFTLTKGSFLKPVLLYLMCIAVIILAFIYNHRFELNFTTVTYPLIAILGALIITYVYYIAPTRADDPMEDLEVEYAFEDDYIQSGGKKFNYDELYGVYEDKNYFYFYTNESDGFLIAKEDAEFDIKAFIGKKITKKKKLHFLKEKKNSEKKRRAAHA
ncbi:MAG: YcxB family protein [Ruminococcus sp.]|nr:YcxB family protein [Ruminococcus sp.]